MREAPAIALSIARLRDGSVLEHAVQQAFVIGMRYALLLGLGLLLSVRCSCGSTAHQGAKQCWRRRTKLDSEEAPILVS